MTQNGYMYVLLVNRKTDTGKLFIKTHIGYLSYHPINGEKLLINFAKPYLI